jgi:cytochrome P450
MDPAGAPLNDSLDAPPAALLLRGEHGAPEPPLARGLPGLGNALDMLRDPSSFFLRAYRRHGRVFRYRVPGRSGVVIAGLDGNRLLGYGEADGLFSPGGFFDDFAAQLGSEKIMIGAHGEPHRQLRHSFKAGMSRTIMEKRIDGAVALTRSRLRTLPPGRALPVRQLCSRLVSDQLGRVLANYDASDYFADIRRVMTTLLETTITRRWPRILLRSPLYRRSRRRVHELSELLIARHRTPPTDPDERDLIDDLVSVLERGVLDRCDAVMITLTPYFAGLDTVAGTLAFVLYALHAHPALLPPLVAEADAAFAGGTLAPEALRRMSRLQAVVLETMRLYPTTILSLRRALVPFVFAGRQIHAGDELHFAHPVTHRLAELFPDPERFDVGRYDPPRAEHKQQGAYVPFGLGPHTCLGAGLAQAQIMATVATLLHEVELRVTPPGYVLRRSFVPLPAPVGMSVELVRVR